MKTPTCVCEDFHKPQYYDVVVSFECPVHGKVTIDRRPSPVTCAGSGSNVGPITDAIATKSIPRPRYTPQEPMRDGGCFGTRPPIDRRTRG